ncbi:hypothetical protein [Caudoviricetes sp.]|nr:hypothetical protein [Caudoviricetes sp.]
MENTRDLSRMKNYSQDLGPTDSGKLQRSQNGNLEIIFEDKDTIEIQKGHAIEILIGKKWHYTQILKIKNGFRATNPKAAITFGMTARFP